MEWVSQVFPIFNGIKGGTHRRSGRAPVRRTHDLRSMLVFENILCQLFFPAFEPMVHELGGSSTFDLGWQSKSCPSPASQDSPSDPLTHLATRSKRRAVFFFFFFFFFLSFPSRGGCPVVWNGWSFASSRGRLQSAAAHFVPILQSFRT